MVRILARKATNKNSNSCPVPLRIGTGSGVPPLYFHWMLQTESNRRSLSEIYKRLFITSKKKSSKFSRTSIAANKVYS